MTPTADPLATRLRAQPSWFSLGLALGTVATALLTIVLVVSVAGATARYTPFDPRVHRALVGLPLVALVYGLGLRLVLRAPAEWFGVRRADRRVVGWIVVGFLLPTLGLSIHVLVFRPTVDTSEVRLAGLSSLVVASLAAGLLAAVVEEVAFRGVLLRILEARWGSVVAALVTSIVFAILHVGHANDWVSAALVVTSIGTAGLLLAVIAIRTRSVWNAVAVHAGWNTVFSGELVAAVGSVAPSPTAPIVLDFARPSTWVTGGELSLSAAPLTTVLLLVVAGAVAHPRLARHLGPTHETWWTAGGTG